MENIISTDKIIFIKVELTIINYKLQEKMLHQEGEAAHTVNGRICI